MNGVWIVYVSDWNDIPKALFDNELEARRYAMDNYANVKYWEFDTEWDGTKI